MPSKLETAAAWRWLVVLVPAALLYFAPVPALNPGQRHLVAIFLGTIISLVAQPVPMGVSVLVAMTALALLGVVPPAKALSGFSNATVWLICSAFLFARAVTATSFGLRVAYLLIRRFGHSALTLGYSIGAANVLLGPFIPSDTARGGGVIYPIARGLAQAFQSEPGPTARRIGSFLILVGYHSTYTASAMFLTSMASNPLIADFARTVAHVELTWVRWALGSCVPAALSFVIAPFLLYRLHTPELRDTSAAQALARDKLREMGPMSWREKALVATLLLVMAGWVTSQLHSIPNAFVALTGVCTLVLARVITWDDLIGERKAWDALFWFAPLLMMSDVLNEMGVIKLVSQAAFAHLAGLPWPLTAAALVLTYVYVHYCFASMTAHAMALYPGFLAAAVAGGVPGMLAALALAYFSSLNAGISHYGTGSAPVFFCDGYVSQSEWWRLGFLLSLVNLAIWLGIGPLWWKVAGLW